ncbi:hypothetical protein SBRCBS47491_009099 [Sporothrix bragantina]|uniref:Transcription factor domain-containing protein n=1 Tax=Sporothrix bragantina TaxID=671064 RepID=A0ABP0CRW8_9PEZI
MTAPETTTGTTSSEPSDPKSPTGQLCTWVSSLTFDAIPVDLRTRAKYIILDGVACGLVGAHLPWSEKAAAAIFDLEPLEGGTADVMGHGRRVTPLNAALLNSSFIQGFELDDWHIGAPLHSNSIILPVLLAAGDHMSMKPGTTPCSGQDLLVAYIAGLEVGPRVGLALYGPHMLSMGWHSGAVFGPPAAAASASKLLSLTAGQIEDAIGIACTQAGGLMSAQFESEVKRMQHGFAARSGLLGAILARGGYVGIKRVFEREYGGFLKQFSAGNGMEPAYKVDEICKGLGEKWQMEGVAIKPYASMAGTHNTVDCVADLQRKHPQQLAAENLGNVKRILIELSKPAFEHGGWVAARPLTATGAQMNNAYVAATCLVDGEDLPAQYSAHMLERDLLWDLIGKTTCELGQDFEKMRTRVTIWFKDGPEPISADREAAKGVIPPVTNEEILDKWRSITANVIDDERRQKIEEVVLNLESDAQCSSQLLDEEEVSSREIRDCFTLFFDFYSPFLPILDASTSPDEYFQQSPFLFWIITYIGSRRYTRDPTLLYRLAPKINSMALLALESSRPIQTIQGILLLCLWPVPVNTMHRDFSLVLGGAALHLAMQVGLHVAGPGQDFSRTMVSGNQFERATGLREGIMPLGLNDASTWSAQEDGRNAGEPAQESRFRHRIHDIMMSATTALKQVDLSSRHLGSRHQKNQDSALLSCISLFDAQLLELAPRAQTSLDSIYLQCYHIHLLAYHFLVGPASRRSEGFIRLYTLACTLLLNTCDQEDTTNNSQGAVVKHCPVFIERALMLAAMSILKIHRSGDSSSSTDMISKHLDLELGERAYFAAMVATRELSLQNDDLGARGATIMGQLWNSKSIFRKKNGEVDSLGCRVRSRLSMSVVFDCLWWWRQEFGGQGNPFTEESRMQTRRPSPTPGADGAEVMYQQRTPFEEGADAGTGGSGGGGGGFDAPDTEAFMFPGEPFSDYDWATSLNVNGWF